MSRRALLCLLLLPAATGRAATRAFAETYETRTGSEGDAQIESWIDDDDAFQDWDVWRFWWGGTASLSDSVEISTYVLAAQQEGANDPNASGLQLEMLYLMARWRFFGDGAHGFSLMGQLEFCLPVESNPKDAQTYNYLSHATALGERLIASYDTAHFIASANLLLEEAAVWSPGSKNGVDLGSSEYFLHAALKWTAGLAWAPLPPGLHGPPFTLGVEAFGDVAAQDFDHAGVWSVWWPGAFPVAVGPALSFASGRFWATASWGYAPGGAYADPTLGLPRWSASEGVGRLIAAFEF
ncbi:MAG: hypothetical protein ACYDCL_09905 [Myxococcales bacterium]